MTVIELPLPLLFLEPPGPGDLPCHFVDPDLFFADTGVDIELAKSLCHLCPARAECLAGALERREPHGVWGGQLFADGVVIARKRPRGRPRKHPAPVVVPQLPTRVPASPFRAA